MIISEKEVLRYLGYGGKAADSRTTRVIAEVSDELERLAAPKSVFRLWDCRIKPPVTELGGLSINSAKLSARLRGCRRAALFAATLGAGADALLRRYGVADMEKAAIAHAVCTAMLEAYCDDASAKLSQTPELSGLYPCPRFSPGYGDFDISHQRDFLRLLDAPRRIGLTLTGGNMLAPSKSVTAVIGFSEEKRGCDKYGKCAACDRPCAFRE